MQWGGGGGGYRGNNGVHILYFYILHFRVCWCDESVVLLPFTVILLTILYFGLISMVSISFIYFILFILTDNKIIVNTPIENKYINQSINLTSRSIYSRRASLLAEQ